MATTYDKASLVMIPSGYKDDKLYSIKPTDGSGDFTFSRDGAGASPATRVNAKGLIEKGRTNELLQSNTFSTTWLTNFISLSGGQSGYDGSSDAWEMTDTRATGNGTWIYQNISRTGVLNFSFYAKAGTQSFLRCLIIGTGGATLWVDLSNGTISNQTDVIASSATSVGGGWYRISFSGNVTASAVRIQMADAAGSSSSTLGATTFIQDAQLESGLVATDYIETTTAPVSAGLLGDMPRLDYSGGATCPSLLLEPSRVNALSHSEYLGGWNAVNCSVTANSTTSPEGVINSFKITEDSSASTQHRISESGLGLASAIYTMSVYVKNSSGIRMAYIDMGPVTAHFNFSTKTIYSATGTADFEDVGNGWYRIWATSNSAITIGTAYIGLSNNNNETYSGDGSSAIEFYGAQLEAGSYPTSYIPTYGSASTRGVDAAVNSLGTSYFPTAGFSVFLEGDTTYDSITNFADLYQIAGTSAQLRLETRTSGRIHIQQGNMVTSGDNFNAYNLCATTAKKICLTFSPTQMNAYVDGALVNSFNGAYTWDITDLNMAMQTSSISYKQTLVFPSVLTSSEALALTTI